MYKTLFILSVGLFLFLKTFTQNVVTLLEVKEGVPEMETGNQMKVDIDSLFDLASKGKVLYSKIENAGQKSYIKLVEIEINHPTVASVYIASNFFMQPINIEIAYFAIFDKAKRKFMFDIDYSGKVARQKFEKFEKKFLGTSKLKLRNPGLSWGFLLYSKLK